MSEKQWKEIEARFAGPLKLARRPVAVTFLVPEKMAK